MRKVWEKVGDVLRHKLKVTILLLHVMVMLFLLLLRAGSVSSAVYSNVSRHLIRYWKLEGNAQTMKVVALILILTFLSTTMWGDSSALQIDKGAVLTDNGAGYFEINNVLHINQSPFRVLYNQWAYTNISNRIGTTKDFTITISNDVVWAGLERGTVNEIGITVPVNATIVIVNGTNSTTSYNYTQILVNVTNWTSLPLTTFWNGTESFTGITAKNFTPGYKQFRVMITPANLGEYYSGTVKKYSIFINTSVNGEQRMVDFDPYVSGVSLNESAIWSMGNDTKDSSSNTLFNLTNSGISFAQDTIGNVTVTKGVNTQDEYDYANITTTSLNCGSASGCTIVTWLKKTGTKYNTLFENGNMFAGSMGVTTQTGSTTMSQSWGGADMNSPANYYSGNTWNFAVYIYNATTGKEMRNGTSIIVSSTATTGRTAGGTFRIGDSSNGGAGSTTDGGMDYYCVRFYNATLNETHIQKLYNGGNATCEKLSTLMAVQGGSSAANESEGDTAIDVGITSSLSNPTRYSEQQVYVRNLSDNQTLGRFDWVASFGSQRWLLNYVTTGESYVRAPNLTTAVYVLEITEKTSAQITDEVSMFINATKS